MKNINHLILKIKQHYTCPIILQRNIQVMKELLGIAPIYILSLNPRPYG
jgi:hypothetical protein